MFTLVKVLDLIYITCLLFFTAIAVSYLLNNFIFVLGMHNSSHKLILLASVLVRISIIVVASYLLRNVLQYIPSPFNGLYGFKHLKVKELSAGTLLTTLLFIFQDTLKNDALRLL